MARSITQTRARSRLRGMWRDQADWLGRRSHIHCAVQRQVNCARLQPNVGHGVSQRSHETGGRSTPVRVRIVGDARGRQRELEAQPAQMHVCPHRRGVPRLAVAIEIDRHAAVQRIVPMSVRMTVLAMNVTMTRQCPVMPMRHVPLGMSVAHAGGHRRRGDQKRRQQPAKQILSIISTHRNTPSHSAPLVFMLGAGHPSVNDTRERANPARDGLLPRSTMPRQHLHQHLANARGIFAEIGIFQFELVDRVDPQADLDAVLDERRLPGRVTLQSILGAVMLQHS